MRYNFRMVLYQEKVQVKFEHFQLNTLTRESIFIIIRICSILSCPIYILHHKEPIKFPDKDKAERVIILSDKYCGTSGDSFVEIEIREINIACNAEGKILFVRYMKSTMKLQFIIMLYFTYIT